MGKKFTDEYQRRGNLSSFDEFKMGIKDVMCKQRTLQSRAKYIVSGYNLFLMDMKREADRVNPSSYATMSNTERAEKQPKITATFEIKDHDLQGAKSY